MNVCLRTLALLLAGWAPSCVFGNASAPVETATYLADIQSTRCEPEWHVVCDARPIGQEAHPDDGYYDKFECSTPAAGPNPKSAPLPLGTYVLNCGLRSSDQLLASAEPATLDLVIEGSVVPAVLRFSVP